MLIREHYIDEMRADLWKNMQLFDCKVDIVTLNVLYWRIASIPGKRLMQNNCQCLLLE